MPTSRLSLWLLLLLAGVSMAAETGTSPASKAAKAAPIYTSRPHLLPPEAQTLFGLSYSSGEQAKIVFAPNAQRSATSTAAAATNPRGAKQQEPVDAQQPLQRSLDYTRMLAGVPFEMITSSRVTIDGGALTTGQSFSVNMPLSMLVAKPALLPCETSITVQARFLIKAIERGSVTLQLTPDPRYPAYQSLLVYKIQ